MSKINVLRLVEKDLDRDGSDPEEWLPGAASVAASMPIKMLRAVDIYVALSIHFGDLFRRT